MLMLDRSGQGAHIQNTLLVGKVKQCVCLIWWLMCGVVRVFVRVSGHIFSETVELCSKRANFVGDTRCEAILPSTQQPLKVLKRKHSSPSKRRLCLERDAATSCEHLAFDRGPSPRVNLAGIRAARGLEKDPVGACTEW